jgi:CBS domain-containing protein
MKIKEVMANVVWTCHENDPLSVPARLMWEHDIGAVPVLGAEEKLVGIVTDRDLCMSAYFTGAPLGSTPVSHAMSTVVFTVEPEQSVEAAEGLMRTKQIRRLPVMTGAKVVGMISLGQIARAAKGKKEVTAGEVSATLAAIVEPRPMPAAPAIA